MPTVEPEPFEGAEKAWDDEYSYTVVMSRASNYPRLWSFSIGAYITTGARVAFLGATLFSGNLASDSGGECASSNADEWG